MAKKKPTMKEVTETIDQMMANMNWLKNNLDMVGRLFDLYVESKDDTETFKTFLDKRQKEYEASQAKAKEKANEQSTDEPTDDKDSGDSDGDKK